MHFSGEVNIININDATLPIVNMKSSDYQILGYQTDLANHRLFYFSNLGLQGARVSIVNLIEQRIETSFDIDSNLETISVDPKNLRIGLCY